MNDIKEDLRQIVRKAYEQGIEKGRLELRKDQSENVVIAAVCALALGFIVGYMV